MLFRKGCDCYLNLRPVLAGRSCPLNRLSELLDKILQPYQQFIRLYTKNNIQCLNNLPKTITDNEIFITYDVTSLYSNIRHDLGIEAISYWIDRHPELLERFTKEFLIEDLKLILNNNYFEFNSKYYLQQIGTAMGTRMTPYCANLTLGYLEENLCSKIETKISSYAVNILKKNYYRYYLDDIFCIWDSCMGDKSLLHDALQELHSCINFTCDSFGDSVNFLDINVYRENGHIYTDIYYKKSDSR